MQKLLIQAGTSIIENASSNRDFWEQWHFNIGFNRFEIYTKNKFKLKYRIMPVSFGLTIAVAFNTKFNLKKTLQTGEFIFSTNTLNYQPGARTYGNIITFTDNEINYQIIKCIFLENLQTPIRPGITKSAWP